MTLKATAPTPKPNAIVIKDPSFNASSINENAMDDKKIPAAKAERSALSLSGYRKIMDSIAPIRNPLDTNVENIKLFANSKTSEFKLITNNFR